MARREVNVFSLSFLDLLSGALGAVLILYVIFPKMTSEVQAKVEELEEIHRMNVTVQRIDSILVALQASVPAEALAPLQAQIQTLQGAVSDLRTAVNGLQLDLQNCQANLQQCEAHRETLQGQIETLQSQITEVEQQLEACEVNRSTLAGELQTCQAALARTFLVVYITWPTRGDDVDLHLVDPAGAEFFYQKKTIPGRPGILSEDNTNGPGTEVWEVREADPGTYQLYVKLFDHESGQPIPVRGRIFYRDGSQEIPTHTLNQQDEKPLIMTFTVGADGGLSVASSS